MTEKVKANTRSELDVAMEQLCLTCKLPECVDGTVSCPFVQKYGLRQRSRALILDTCGKQEIPEWGYGDLGVKKRGRRRRSNDSV